MFAATTTLRVRRLTQIAASLSHIANPPTSANKIALKLSWIENVVKAMIGVMASSRRAQSDKSI